MSAGEESKESGAGREGWAAPWACAGRPSLSLSRPLTVLLRHALIVLVAVGVGPDQLGAGAHNQGLVAEGRREIKKERG